MSALYQAWDEGAFDYDLYPFGDLALRGPRPRGARPSIAFIGAAQTFGRLCHAPFPNLVAAALDVDALNFGVGGKGPEFFLRRDDILGAANRAELVVVQVLSGRSVSNAAFQAADGGRDGVRLPDGRPMSAEDVYDDLLRGRDRRGRDAHFMAALVEETRRTYASQMIGLLQAIERPKILLWFSVRSPERPAGRLDLSPHALVGLVKRAGRALGVVPPFEGLLGAFPQLVDRATLERVRPHADRYVECVGRAGLPQAMRRAGRRVIPWNNYYPSPEMHRAAADALLPECQRLLGRGVAGDPGDTRAAGDDPEAQKS
jgi:hypothetical protein